MKRLTPTYSLCPKDPSHGPLLDIDGKPTCVHSGCLCANVKPAVNRWRPAEPVTR